MSYYETVMFSKEYSEKLISRLSGHMYVIDASALGEGETVDSVREAIIGENPVGSTAFGDYVGRNVLVNIEITPEDVCGQVIYSTDHWKYYMCVVHSEDERTQKLLGENYHLLVDNLWVVISSVEDCIFGSTCACIKYPTGETPSPSDIDGKRVGYDNTSGYDIEAFICYTGLDFVTYLEHTSKPISTHLYSNVARWAHDEGDHYKGDPHTSGTTAETLCTWRGWRAKKLMDINQETDTTGFTSSSLKIRFGIYRPTLSTTKVGDTNKEIYEDSDVLMSLTVAESEMGEVRINNLSNPYTLVFLFDDTDVVAKYYPTSYEATDTTAITDRSGFVVPAFSCMNVWLPMELPWFLGHRDTDIIDTIPSEQRCGSVTMYAQALLSRVEEGSSRVWLYGSGDNVKNYHGPCETLDYVRQHWDDIWDAYARVGACQDSKELLIKCPTEDSPGDVVMIDIDVQLAPSKYRSSALTIGTYFEEDGTLVENKSAVENYEVIINNLRGREFLFPLSVSFQELWDKFVVTGGSTGKIYWRVGYWTYPEITTLGDKIYHVNLPYVTFGGEKGLRWWTLSGLRERYINIFRYGGYSGNKVMVHKGMYAADDSIFKFYFEDLVSLNFLYGRLFGGSLWRAPIDSISVTLDGTNLTEQIIFKDYMMEHDSPDINWGLRVHKHYHKEYKTGAGATYIDGSTTKLIPDVYNPFDAEGISLRSTFTRNANFTSDESALYSGQMFGAVHHTSEGTYYLYMYENDGTTPVILERGNYIPSHSQETLNTFGPQLNTYDTDASLMYKSIVPLDIPKNIVAINRGKYFNGNIFAGLIRGTLVPTNEGVLDYDAMVPSSVEIARWTSRGRDVLLELPLSYTSKFLTKWIGNTSVNDGVYKYTAPYVGISSIGELGLPWQTIDGSTKKSDYTGYHEDPIAIAVRSSFTPSDEDYMVKWTLAGMVENDYSAITSNFTEMDAEPLFTDAAYSVMDDLSDWHQGIYLKDYRARGTSPSLWYTVKENFWYASRYPFFDTWYSSDESTAAWAPITRVRLLSVRCPTTIKLQAPGKKSNTFLSYNDVSPGKQDDSEIMNNWAEICDAGTADICEGFSDYSRRGLDSMRLTTCVSDINVIYENNEVSALNSKTLQVKYFKKETCELVPTDEFLGWELHGSRPWIGSVYRESGLEEMLDRYSNPGTLPLNMYVGCAHPPLPLSSYKVISTQAPCTEMTDVGDSSTDDVTPDDWTPSIGSDAGWTDGWNTGWSECTGWETSTGWEDAEYWEPSTGWS